LAVFDLFKTNCLLKYMELKMIEYIRVQTFSEVQEKGKENYKLVCVSAGGFIMEKLKTKLKKNSNKTDKIKK